MAYRLKRPAPRPGLLGLNRFGRRPKLPSRDLGTNRLILPNDAIHPEPTIELATGPLVAAGHVTPGKRRSQKALESGPFASQEVVDDNEEHSIGSAHERKAVKAREWSAWVLPIEFIELSESIAYGY